jgi:BASS family bile acid:Na+ symporter
MSGRGGPRLHGLGFTLAVIGVVAAALAWPEPFRRWGSFETKALIVPLIQLIMLGMGATLGLADFARVLVMPWPVFVGVLLQFAVMPLVGWSLAARFGFEPMVAAGVILVGACPGGVASNVITYLAGGNVPLSVTMTACSTLVSPVMTPLAMKLLAGQHVPVSFWGMMLDILNMVLVPVALGVALSRVLGSRSPLGRLLPLVSMGGICLIIGIITALSRDKLLAVAPTLIAAVAIHNGAGYLLGYGGARLLRLDERDARTVAIEVGLQNGGMASGLAISALRSADAGLAAAVFGPWMNASGSVLASYWRRRTPRAAASNGPAPAADRTGRGGVRRAVTDTAIEGEDRA